MMNQTAQIAGEKKLKLVVFRGALTLSGHKISVDISRQLWYSPSSSHCEVNRNVLSFSYVEIYDNKLYIRGNKDFSDEEYEKRIRQSEKTFAYSSQKRAEEAFVKHKKNLLDAATWVAAEFEAKMKDKHG